MEEKKNTIFLYYAIACALFVVCAAGGYIVSTVAVEKPSVVPYEPEAYHTLTEEVTADAAIIYTLSENRIIAGKNVNKLKSIASITKIIAALVAYPRLSETDNTTLTADDFKVTANTPLRLGDNWSTRDLLEYSLITSSNRGIQAVARTIEEKTGASLIDLMHSFIHQNALVQTHFINPTGLDVHSALAGSESSALDLARIAGIIIEQREDLAKWTTQEKRKFYSQKGNTYDASNTNILIGDIPDRVLLSKTGNTDLAGASLIMVTEYNDQKIAFVVLDSTTTGRFEDMRRLLLLYKDGADREMSF